MALDYRELEKLAGEAQERASKLRAEKKTAEADYQDVTACSLLNLAAQMKEREQGELRAIVAGGATLSGIDDLTDAGDFIGYLKTGKIVNASMSSSDGNGGLIIPESLHAALVEKQRLVDPILAGATQIDLTGGMNPDLQLPYKATHGVAAGAAELAARSEQNAPTFTSATLNCYEIYSDQRVSQLAADSIPDFEKMMAGWIVEDVYEQFSAHLATGAGTATEAAGLFTASSYYPTKLSGSAGALVNTCFHTAFFALPAKFRPGAVWVMNSNTLATVSMMAHPASTAYEPLAKQNDAGDWVIAGKKVEICESAPDIGAGNYPVAFADLKNAYVVATHRRPTTLVDDLTAPPFRRFWTLARLGGSPWNPAAAVLVKSNNS